ncbi:MAG TPA: glycosyltransferase family 9 protein [Bryobacteraceae bacterium]|nr:glycosyltransferase family 9 protein [Bryobacteraceae bacterium]
MFRAGKTVNRQGGPRILVVRLGSMGDIVHTLPAVATLKHGFPGSTLTWVVHPRWTPLLEGNPYVDRVVRFDRRSGASFREAWRGLRASPYEFAVDFQGLIQSALVATVARPDHLFGFHQSQVRERLSALFYSDRVRAVSAHVIDRNLELARAAGAATILKTFPLPEGLPEGDLPDEEFVLACPMAGWAGKQWPIGSYSVLAAQLRSELGVGLVLNGPPSAAPQLATVAGARVHVSGISGLICATRRAIAVVGCDSGPVHLAAALGRPGVAIFGPTDPARNGPYGDTFTVLRSAAAGTTYKRRSEPEESMRDITPEAVVEALRARIGARRPASI